MVIPLCGEVSLPRALVNRPLTALLQLSLKRDLGMAMHVGRVLVGKAFQREERGWMVAGPLQHSSGDSTLLRTTFCKASIFS